MVVSVVNVCKDTYQGIKTLDPRAVETITAFLFHDGGHGDLAVLLANANKSFQGSIVLGMGFTFDDTNTEATSIAEMHRLSEKDRAIKNASFPTLVVRR